MISGTRGTSEGIGRSQTNPTKFVLGAANGKATGMCASRTFCGLACRRIWIAVCGFGCGVCRAFAHFEALAESRNCLRRALESVPSIRFVWDRIDRSDAQQHSTNTQTDTQGHRPNGCSVRTAAPAVAASPINEHRSVAYAPCLGPGPWHRCCRCSCSCCSLSCCCCRCHHQQQQPQQLPQRSSPPTMMVTTTVVHNRSPNRRSCPRLCPL